MQGCLCERINNVWSKSGYHLVLQFQLSLLFEGILPTSQRFHGWGTSTLCLIVPLSVWRNTVVLLRNCFMLEGRGSSSLVSTVNWVCCIREYGLPLSVFKNEKHYLCWKWPYTTERNRQCSFVRESFTLEAKGPRTLFCSLIWVYV
jgi:hypothetical protein